LTHWTGLLVLLAACGVSAPVLAQCSIPPVASFPLLAEGRPIIPIVIERRDATMMVDTGAEATSVTPEAAQLLNLARDPSKYSVISTVAGKEARPNVLLNHLQAGPLDFGRHSVPIVALGSANTFGGHLIAGLLGMDFFGAYDIEVDVPGHRMRLYPPSACTPAEPPWPRGTYVSVEAVATPRRRLLVPVSLNGMRLVALLDTGAQGELLTRLAAERVGLSTMQIDSGPVAHGISAGAHTYPVRMFRFDSFGVAGETMRGVVFPVGEFQQDGVEMLLGINYMRLHRVFMALSARRLFIQRADGGPMAPTAAAVSAPVTAPQGVDHCRAPAYMVAAMSREALRAVTRPRLPVPASVQGGLTEACAGVAFHVAADGTVHGAEVLIEWPSGYGVGDYVRRELEATRFLPGLDGGKALHYEAHRLHAN
jgi:predicted aspartyl protease